MSRMDATSEPTPAEERDLGKPLSGWCRDKVAIVTGGGGGIGRALGALLARSGAAGVTLVDRDAQSLRDAVDEIDLLAPGRILAHVADVTATGAMVDAAEATVARFGRIDVLVNNAGAPFVGAFDAVDDADWKRAFDLNFFAPIMGIRAVLPAMRRQGGGTIVNVISGMAFMPMAYQSMYAATKAALNAMSLALRYEIWDDGIRVISATPGTTATSIWGPEGMAPSSAQSPEASADAILHGVARNDRLVLGDEPDRRGARRAFDPDAADAVDAYLLDVARRRRNGTSTI